MALMTPRESGKFIASKAKHVLFHDDKITELSKKILVNLKEGKIGLEEFKQNDVLPLDKNLSTEDLANWVFLVDTLNFNFWTPKEQPKFTVAHGGKKRSGYMGMVNAVNRAIDEGIKIYDPNYYSKLQLDDIDKIFRSSTSSKIPLKEERIRVVQEVGTILLDKYSGSFINVLKKAEGSALKLVDIVSSEFPCFRDVATYDGVDVALFKRVQILAADIWMLYRGEGLGDFKDIDELTMFADYRVPQSLAYFGAISYSPTLMKILEDEVLIKNGDVFEVEIRGCSIEAVERLVKEVRRFINEKKLDLKINSMMVDYWLWDYRISNAAKLDSIPYHKTRCIYY